MAYFVGLDSGGTKTECWLADETQILGRAAAGTVKLTRVGRELATERLHTLLSTAAAEARVDLRDLTRTCIGISGFSIPEVRDWASETLAQLVGGEVEVCGDDEIALDAAFKGGAGILVIGGTGAVVLGRCTDGTRFTAGGWGPMIGDEGSGFWIGREAVKRAFWAFDRGQSTLLLEAIQAAWDVRDLYAIVGFANSRAGADFAALTPAVVHCAAQGDPLAERILASAGDELAAQVGVVWKKMVNHGELTAPYAYTGSVVEKIPAVRARMFERIAHGCPGLRPREGSVNSLEGAIWRARGRPTPQTPSMRRRAASSPLMARASGIRLEPASPIEDV